ncbi:MAG: NADP-dependent malic enzyme [Oligoflexales bacterium]|nr:NADP-dependent malic enzyme [Oligoflexales bacterium]
MDFEKEALSYHMETPKGKIAIKCTKPLDTQEDLAKAYSPGVAGPCRKIAEDENETFRYTSRGNLVGVISNGSAVLGLGNIGPFAAKPVMEGKAMLFKKFADIDVFDIEVNASDPDDFISTVKSLEPTFGGINLEDIKAPECFYIEEKLKKEMNIPVFHDDQHGTAIIAAAAFINALELTKRKLSEIKVVFSGAGAAAISCASLFKTLGVGSEQILMCDSKGVIHSEREDLNPYKKRFANKTDRRTLADALEGADAFVGVSTADILTPQMLQTMAKSPIVFALANPNPEINPELAKRTRADVIMATGRSDFPNQVNNVLGFPYIFRGALDVRATTINEEMKLAAVHAIAQLAKEDVPEEVMNVYNRSDSYIFGRDYLIPKPVDHRVLLKVAPAVAKAAMDTGVARKTLDLREYCEEIERILGPTRKVIRNLRTEIAAQSSSKKFIPKIALTAGADHRVLRAAKQCTETGEVRICLLGKEEKIKETAQSLGIQDLKGIEIIDPNLSPVADDYAQCLYELRNRKGVSRTIAEHVITDENYFAAIMLHRGDVDGVISGVKSPYNKAIKPLLEIIRTEEGKTLAGVYMLVKDKTLTFVADCTVNIDPDSEQLADIALSAAEIAKHYTNDPIRVAMLGFASFGASSHDKAKKVSRAVKIIKKRAPQLEVDGEMQADVALDPSLRSTEFPFCNLKGRANVLIFPDLNSANISYKLLTSFGEVSPTGPILVGIKKPAHVMQRTASVQELIDMIYLSAHQVMIRKKETTVSP